METLEKNACLTYDEILKFQKDNNFPHLKGYGPNNNNEGQEFLILSKSGCMESVSFMLIDSEMSLFEVINITR
jgi:hypothetical protein